MPTRATTRSGILARGCRAAVGIAALVLPLTGCDDDAEGSPLAVVDHSQHPVATVSVTPDAVTVLNGDSLTFQAVPRCGCGEIVERPVAWLVDRPEIAVVHQDGSLHARGPGLATLLAVAEGRQGFAQISIEPRGTLVDATGGIAVSADGRARALFPPGALTAATDVVIEPVEPVPGGEGSRFVEGTAYRFSPESVHFGAPVGLELQYDPASLPAGVHRSGLRLHLLRGGRWNEVEGSVVAADPDRITGVVDHFSIYGLAAVREAVSGVDLVPEVVSLAVGEDAQLSVRIVDAAGVPARGRAVEWSSSDPDVVTVDEGRVHGVSLGEAVVTARSEDVTGTARVTVVERAARVVLEPEVTHLFQGGILRLHARVVAADGRTLDRPLVWTSDAPDVARVLGTGTALRTGTVSGLAGGRAGIRAAVAGSPDIFAEAWVSVSWRPVSLTISPSDVRLEESRATRLEAVALDADGNVVDGPVSWWSREPHIAHVDGEGRVMGVVAGDAVIEVTMHELTATRTVEVVGPPTELRLQPDGTLQLVPGEASTVRALLVDAAGHELDSAVAWSMDSPGIVDLVPTDPGGREVTLTALSEGTVTLGVTAQGRTAALLVTVAADGGHGGGEGGCQGGGGQGGGSQGGGKGGCQGGGGQTGGGGGQPPGGHEDGTGNNLSWPVVFAEGIGVSGLAVGQDTGLRPRPDEGIAVAGLPFWAPTNAPDYQGTYYEQQGSNTWQAEWIDGTASGVQRTSIYWGDNLTHHTWNTHSVIRIEHTLTALDGSPMSGFPMTWLYGQGPTEMQGADGSVAPFQPTVYSVMPELVLQKLDNTTGAVLHQIDVGTIADGLGQDGPGYYSAEVNVGGKVIYGYNWFVRNESLPTGVHRFGWWRIIFRLQDQASVAGATVVRNTSLDGCGNAVAAAAAGEDLAYTPRLDPATNASWLDIWIDQASGGGGGGGGGPGTGGHTGGGGGGGGCGSH